MAAANEPLGRRKLAFSEQPSPEHDAEVLANQNNPQIGQEDNVSKEKGGKKSYEFMVIETITENDPKRKGLSFAKIQQFLKGKYMLDGEIKFYVKKAYQKLLEKKTIEHVTGNGFTGSIRLSKEYVENMKQKEKSTEKKARAEKTKPAKRQISSKGKQSDKNNNTKTAKSKATPKDATNVNPKKTAITKTKIDRKSGKVRLSISAVPVPVGQNRAAKPKMKGLKNVSETKPKSVKKGSKGAGTNQSDGPKPKKQPSAKAPKEK